MSSKFFNEEPVNQLKKDSDLKALHDKVYGTFEAVSEALDSRISTINQGLDGLGATVAKTRADLKALDEQIGEEIFQLNSYLRVARNQLQAQKWVNIILLLSFLLAVAFSLSSCAPSGYRTVFTDQRYPVSVTTGSGKLCEKRYSSVDSEKSSAYYAEPCGVYLNYSLRR